MSTAHTAAHIPCSFFCAFLLRISPRISTPPTIAHIHWLYSCECPRFLSTCLFIAHIHCPYDCAFPLCILLLMSTAHTIVHVYCACHLHTSCVCILRIPPRIYIAHGSAHSFCISALAYLRHIPPRMSSAYTTTHTTAHFQTTIHRAYFCAFILCIQIRKSTAHIHCAHSCECPSSIPTRIPSVYHRRYLPACPQLILPRISTAHAHCGYLCE